MTLQSFNNKILQYDFKLTNGLITMQKYASTHHLKYALPNVEINKITGILCICYQNEQNRKLYVNQFVSPRTHGRGQAINITLTFEGQQV